jgi:hypothetical protein
MSHVVWVSWRTGRSGNADPKRAKPRILCVIKREEGKVAGELTLEDLRNTIKRPRQNSNANGSASAATVGEADAAPLQILPHGLVVVEVTLVVVEETVVSDEVVLPVTVTVLMLVVYCTTVKTPETEVVRLGQMVEVLQLVVVV